MKVLRHTASQRFAAVALLEVIFLFSSTAPSLNAQRAPTKGKELTVERIYSSPSLGGRLTRGLKWTPDGKWLSFFERSGGGGAAKPALWTIDASTGERRMLVDAEKLGSLLPPPKGQPSQKTGLGRRTPDLYFWAPAGNAILFAGGGSLAWLELKTMQSKALVSNADSVEDSKISPDGRWVSYVRGGNVFVINVASGRETQVTSGGSEDVLEGQLDWVYPEELDNTTAYWWSPDSSKIAFLELDERPVTKYPIADLQTGGVETTRYPLAGEANPIVRVGVVPVAGGEPKWMDTGAEKDIYLARVDWLSDSKRVAIQRLNRAQNRLDLLFADVATGASKTILTEEDKYWINISDDLHFLSDGRRFLWSSERTGYRHLYLYDTDGKQLDQLTRGDWGLTGIQGFGPGSENGLAVDERNGFVYFLSNKDNPIERHLYRIALSDKSMTRLTRDVGTHIVDFAPGTGYYLDIYSRSGTPPRQDLYHADGTRALVIDENKVPELAEYHLSPTEFSTVKADDGTTLYASMIKPPDFDPARKYPVVIFTYGGPHAQEVVDAWTGPSYLWNQMMAQKGYIIFTLDNRGSYSRGHHFETPLFHHFGQVELADQLAGVRYLKSLPFVDGSRIGIYGGSYGAYMTLMALLRAGDVFKVGVADAPVTDWRLYDTIYTERYMGRPQDNPDGYKQSSPVTFAGQLKGKLLLIHGTGDDNVHFANTAELLDSLIQDGKYPEIMVFPGRGHGISDLPAIRLVSQHVAQFFLDHL